ncbi:unnamed protein product [Dibothriocephalus latus]|uniref:Uncharacterized protein n=1 Tax=Dibothriocephalus latus TaxID=60516 RepID=A0A3P7P779_DIBLA|nr:unnamed protein product [Dibothriocephalus latus]
MDSFPPAIQHVLAPTSGSLTVAQLTQMGKLLIEMHDRAKLPFAALGISAVPPISSLLDLKTDIAQLTEQLVTLNQQSTSLSWRPPSSSAWHFQPVSSTHPNTATTRRYHTTFWCQSPSLHLSLLLCLQAEHMR